MGSEVAGREGMKEEDGRMEQRRERGRLKQEKKLELPDERRDERMGLSSHGHPRAV